MKKIILSLIIAFSFSFSQDEIKYEDLINIKWQMKRYVIDGLSLPIERKRKNDYQVFKPNNKREEMLFGKTLTDVSWEYLPYGKFIMLYSKTTDVYIPARITELEKNKELRLTFLDINTMKLVTVIYQAK
ncbi:MAG: hypothetical protein VYA83_02875 [Candidatus Neomarinimicrobiota bacterium]|nr:hypothetical protein [Candidatus Neomarinimicrobiota bacterium]MEC9437201.1 hypothetical protein [Candidatus Neomarinimicrobiota bacterium]MED5433520.1 hypothetical protein [Candidatus Neomarinimicrobiota bacterium]